MIELYQGDCVQEMKKIPDNYIDICITDIPYGIDFCDWDVLHNNTNSALGGRSKHQERDTSFKRRGKPINGWSKADKNIPYEYQEWCNKWAKQWAFLFLTRMGKNRKNPYNLYQEILFWEWDARREKPPRNFWL